MQIPDHDPEEIDRLFDRLSELPLVERAAVLDSECPSGEVRSFVERLLGQFDDRAAPLESGVEIAGLAPPTESDPEVVGPYAVRGVLGTGGMGVVYLAEQQKPQRTVAVKVIRAGMLSERARQRFELEAEFLGRLQHPGIAQIFEAGTEGTGHDARAFLAMEFVDGVTLTDYARERGLELRERVRLVARIADAVQHAHQRGVVHRDLKPNNLLVTASGDPKVIDFGVARALGDESTQTQATQAGEVIGTLAYMSPEQVRGDTEAIDTRADVYALGVVAYELLGGVLPIEMRGKSVTAAARVVCEVDPPRLGSIAPACRGDLEWIIARALEKEPERRYASAGALATDLRRYLNHEAVDARPASAVYQLRKIARRHRAVVGGTLATLLAIVIGAGVSLNYALQNKRLAEQEASAREDAKKNEGLALEQAELAARSEERAVEQAALAKANEEKAIAAAALAKTNEDKATEAARVAAEKADDLLRISNFRLNQARFLEPNRVGDAARVEQLAAVRDALAAKGLSEEDLAASLEEFEATLALANSADVGGGVIQRALIAGTLPAIEGEFADKPLLEIKMLIAHGTLLLSLNAYEEAEAVYRRASEVGLAFDPEAPNTLNARIFHASALANLERWDEAEAVLEEVFPIAERVLSPDETTLDVAIGILARIADRDGDLERTEDLFQRSLLLSRARYIEGDIPSLYRVLATMTNLCVVRIKLDKIDAAGDVYHEALELLGDLDPERGYVTMLVLQMGSMWAEASEQWEETVHLCTDALEITDRWRGAQSPESTSFRWTLAHALCANGEFEAGIEVALAVLNGRRARFGDADPVTLEQTRKIVSRLVDQGAGELGRPLAERALAMARAVHGADSDVARSAKQALQSLQ